MKIFSAVNECITMFVDDVNYLFFFSKIKSHKKIRKRVIKKYRNRRYHTNMMWFVGKNGIIPGLIFGDTVGMKTRLTQVHFELLFCWACREFIYLCS